MDAATKLISLNVVDERARGRRERDRERIAYLLALLLLHDRFNILIKSVYAELQMTLAAHDGAVFLSKQFVEQRMEYLANTLLQEADSTLQAAAMYGRLSAQSRYEKETGKKGKRKHDELVFAALVAAFIVERGSYGYPLAASLRDVALGTGLDIQAAIRRAGILGETHEELMRHIKEILLTGKRSFAVRVESLADTEANGAYNEAVKQEAPKLGVLIGFRWVLSAAHKDQGGKEICEQFAGKVYRADDDAIALYPPHRACQCRLIPVYDPKEFL